MYSVKVLTEFAASHHLRDYNGKCENRHGHNWKVEVECVGDDLDSAGLLVDFKVLKKKVNEVLDKLDHFDLNELEPFVKVNPSSENIAVYLYRQLNLDVDLKAKVGISKVSVWENDRSCASYWE